MILTTSKLRSLEACSEGRSWFFRRFPEGCNLSNKNHLNKWLQPKSKDPCSINYNFRKQWFLDTITILCLEWRNYRYCRGPYRLSLRGQELFKYLKPKTQRCTAFWLQTNLKPLSKHRLINCMLQLVDQLKLKSHKPVGDSYLGLAA